MSKLTVTIPDDLHQKIREELERQGITTSQFIEQAITTFFEKPKGVSNMATRTLAFQVSEELLQRIKTFLARYEQIYHRNVLTAKISASPSQETACTLSDILMCDVEEKYFLSPKQQEVLLFKPTAGTKESASTPPKD